MLIHTCSAHTDHVRVHTCKTHSQTCEHSPAHPQLHTCSCMRALAGDGAGGGPGGGWNSGRGGFEPPGSSSSGMDGAHAPESDKSGMQANFQQGPVPMSAAEEAAGGWVTGLGGKFVSGCWEAVGHTRSHKPSRGTITQGSRCTEDATKDREVDQLGGAIRHTNRTHQLPHALPASARAAAHAFFWASPAAAVQGQGQAQQWPLTRWPHPAAQAQMGRAMCSAAVPRQAVQGAAASRKMVGAAPTRLCPPPEQLTRRALMSRWEGGPLPCLPPCAGMLRARWEVGPLPCLPSCAGICCVPGGRWDPWLACLRARAFAAWCTAYESGPQRTGCLECALCHHSTPYGLLGRWVAGGSPCLPVLGHAIMRAATCLISGRSMRALYA